MQEEVSAAAETSDAFSDETLKEYAIFQHEKRAEMKEDLGAVADGQIEMYKKVRAGLKIMCALGVVACLCENAICSRPWKSGTS